MFWSVDLCSFSSKSVSNMMVALTASSGKAGKREAAVRRRSKVRHSDNLKRLDFGEGSFSSMILMLFRIMMMLI